LRSKEEAYDYRYFPEPDLVPVAPSDEWIDAIRAALPMLPRERRLRLAEAASVETEAAALTVERGLDDLAVDAIAEGAAGPRVLVHAENNLRSWPPIWASRQWKSERWRPSWTA